MLFYPSKVNDRLNARPFYPEKVNGRVMLNPNYPIKILLDSNDPWFCCICQKTHSGPCAICDSGAFQDVDTGIRLMQHSALERQLRLERTLKFRANDDDWHFEAICIYDQMAGVDEAMVNGKKVKQRGTPETAAPAVAETLASAAYYAKNRHKIQGHIMFIGQGVTPDQYIDDCLVPMLDVMLPGDYFGFGGFCIIGKMRTRMLPVFFETYTRAIVLLKNKGIKRIHLLGVCIPDAVVFANDVARREGMIASTDSSAPEYAAMYNGAIYVNGRWKKGPYTRAQKYIDYNPCELAMKNIGDYHEWTQSI